MIKEELEKKAKNYAEEQEKHCILGVYDDISDLEYDKCYNEGYINGLEEGYIAGAKENGVIWHDLRKNPNDLPKNQNEVLCLLWEDSYYIGHYHINSKMWCFNEFSLSEDENEDEVTAWCELPKFEVEE